MRAVGLLLILLGIFALAAPTVRESLPFLAAWSNTSLWIVGGCMLALGAIAVSLTGDRNE